MKERNRRNRPKKEDRNKVSNKHFAKRNDREKETVDQEEQETFFGRHVVLKIFKDNKQVNKLFIQKNSKSDSLNDIIKLAKQQKVVCLEVPKSKLDELSNNENHQGVVVTLPSREYASLDDCFALAQKRDQAPFFLILDGIEDPHNLGSILRTADATGVHGVIIPKRRAVGLTGIVAKTSAGAIENVPVVRVTNISQTIEQLQERGVWVFATDMSGEDMRQWNTQGALAIVIGNEGSGVSPNVKKNCDSTVTIPMTGTIQSLNASVAAAVLMYEVARHRI